jgi:hypothetical protein
MTDAHSLFTRARRWWLVLPALAAALLLVGVVSAQETPEAGETVEPAGVPGDGAVMRVVGPAESVTEGDEFSVEVRIEGADHVAAFDFALQFDPRALTYERVGALGRFLEENSERELLCGDPQVLSDGGEVAVSCITPGDPICAGGPSGASGEGVLGRVFFTAEASGQAEIAISSSTLVLDDIEGCDVENPRVPEIEHTTQGAVVDIEASSGFPWLLVAIIAGAAAAALIVGGAIYSAMQARGQTPPPSGDLPDSD